MQTHKHDQQTFGEKSTFAFPLKAPLALTPSKSKGAMARVKDQLYVMSHNKYGQPSGFLKLPKNVNTYTLKKLEERALRIERIRNALALAALGVALIVLALAAL